MNEEYSFDDLDDDGHLSQKCEGCDGSGIRSPASPSCRLPKLGN